MRKNLVTKAASLLLVGVMTIGLIACGNEPQKESSVPSKTSEESKVEESTVEEKVPEAVTYPMDTDKKISVYLGSSAPLHAEYASYKDSYWHSAVSKVTGVDVEWIPKVDLTALDMMCSDPKEAPNIFFRSGKGIAGYRQMVEDGYALELTDYLEEYMPNFYEWVHRPENEDILRNVTDDEGRFYFIPGVQESDASVTYMGPMIRKDWLDECGLKAPVTIEDFENVLVTFKEKYGATFGMAWSDFRNLSFASGTGAYAHQLAALCIRDGKIVFENFSPEWQAYIEVMADWQKKGLFDGDIFTADRKLLRQKVAEGKVGMTFTAASQMTYYIQDAKDAGSSAEWIGIEYPRTAAGEPTSMIQTKNRFADNAVAILSAFTPEDVIPVALAWMDYFFSEEGILFANYGVEGETFEMVNGVPTFTELVTKDPIGIDSALNKYVGFNGTFIGVQHKDLLQAKNVSSTAVVDATMAWTANTVAREHILPMLCLSADEKQKYSDAWTPISTYVNEQVAKYIKGEEKIDWADFKATIEGMGVQTCVDIYQAAYDRYMAK